MDLAFYLALPSVVGSLALLAVWIFETVRGTEEWG